MKCVFIFALVLVSCLALPATWGTKEVKIDADGNITIKTPQGKIVKITKPVSQGDKKKIEVVVSPPFGPTKTIRIDDSNKEITLTDESKLSQDEGDSVFHYLREKRSKGDQTYSQSEILREIFKEFEGTLDQKSYEKLMKKINKSVQRGELSPLIYHVLRYLDETQPFGWESLDEYLRDYESEQFGRRYGEGLYPFGYRDQQYGQQVFGRQQPFRVQEPTYRSTIQETPARLVRVTLEGPQALPTGYDSIRSILEKSRLPVERYGKYVPESAAGLGERRVETEDEFQRQRLIQQLKEYIAVLENALQQQQQISGQQYVSPEQVPTPLIRYTTPVQTTWPYNVYYPQQGLSQRGYYPEQQPYFQTVGQSYEPYQTQYY